jgi:hypothetical protein
MDPRTKSASVAKTPYDDLRRARHGELQLRDGEGLKYLMADYFDHADELELVGPPTHRAA